MKTFLIIIALVMSTFTYAGSGISQYNDHAKQVMLERFSDVADHLFEASHKTGINMAELTAIASLESKLQAKVKNPNSTATGVLQYTKRTWKYKRGKYAQELGIDSNAQPINLRANLLIGSKDLSQTKEWLIENTHLTLDTVRLGDVYISHFLGENGAAKLINSYSHKPINQIVTIHKGNKRYYYKPNGQVRTAREFRLYMDELAKNELAVYERAIMEYQVKRLFEPFHNLIDNIRDVGQVALLAKATIPVT